MTAGRSHTPTKIATAPLIAYRVLDRRLRWNTISATLPRLRRGETHDIDGNAQALIADKPAENTRRDNDPHMTSTTMITKNESSIPRLKNAGPTVPALKLNWLDVNR